MKLLLHIGMHKTGTSALQAFLRGQAPALTAQGVLYPRHGQHHDGAHHQLWHALADRSDTQAFREAIEAEAASHDRPIDTLLLSSEMLEKLCLEPTRRANIEAFIRGFDAVRVIYVLRNQAEVVQSIYKQWIMDDAIRLTIGPADFLTTHGDQLHYSLFTQAWAGLPGPVSLQALGYKADWAALWAGFARATGLSLDASSETRRLNASMDGERLKLKHWLNCHAPRDAVDFDLKAFLKRHFANGPATSLFRDKAQLDAFQAQYAADNRVMATRWHVADLDQGHLAGAPFQTASPALVARFFARLAEDPETVASGLRQVDPGG